MLGRVLRRARAVRMSTPIAAETLRALALLPRADDDAVVATFSVVGQRDSAAVSDAFAKIPVDPALAQHGRRVACMCRALSVARRTDAVVWQGLEAHLCAGLTSAAWSPRDVRDIMRATARWGTYSRTTLLAAADRYAATKAPFASPEGLSAVASGLSAIPEAKDATALHTIAARLVEIAANAPAATFGEVCRSFVRVRFKAPDLLRVVLDELPRITPQLKGSDATALLAFWALHEYSTLVPMVDVPEATTGAGRRAAAAAAEINAPIEATHKKFEELMKRSVAEMPDHADGIVAMLRCVTALSSDQWVCVAQVVDDALTAAAVLSQELLAAEKPIGVEDLTALMPRFFKAVHARPDRLMPHELAQTTHDVFAEHAQGRAEELVSHESSPYFIVTCLLGVTGDPPPAACRKAATEILLEARAQDQGLPTLQTFRYIMSYGDHRDFDRRLVGFLRRSFALTLEGIPLVQLVTALRAFAVAEKSGYAGGEDLPVAEQEREATEMREFMSDVSTALQRRGFSYDLKLLVALTHAISVLREPGTDTTRDLRFHLMESMNVLCAAGPKAAVYPRESAEAVLAFFREEPEARLKAAAAPGAEPKGELDAAGVPVSLVTFLEAVMAEGVEGDPFELKPSAWMKLNDPSNAILPRTAAETKLDNILREVERTSPDDDKALGKLGVAYMRLLPDVHPDNVRLLFEIFAERVIKRDKLLRDALVHLIDNETIDQLAPYSIASILQSAAAVRFSFYKPLKKMLEMVSEEQWALLDATELELVVSSLARLSIRTPSILMALCDRAMALSSSLTERHVCSIIAAFQNLGVHDEALFSALLSQAAKLAEMLTPSSVALLLTGTHAHRLPLNEQNAAPLINRLCRVSDDLTGYQKTRIGQQLKKTSLPPTLLTGATSRLLID